MGVALFLDRTYLRFQRLRPQRESHAWPPGGCPARATTRYATPAHGARHGSCCQKPPCSPCLRCAGVGPSVLQRSHTTPCRCAPRAAGGICAATQGPAAPRPAVAGPGLAATRGRCAGKADRFSSSHRQSRSAASRARPVAQQLKNSRFQ